MAISEANWITLFKAGCDLLQNALIKFGREGLGSENVVALVDAVKSASDGNFSAEQQEAARQFRADYEALVNQSRIRAILDPIFSAFLEDLVDDEFNYDPVSNWQAIYDGFIARGLYVTSRGITYDSSATASGTGNGVVFRLNEDAFGQPLEAGYYPLDITMECARDTSGGARFGEEAFRVSAPRLFDILDQGTGGGPNPPVEFRSINSDQLISDGSFYALGADTADPDNLGGSWVDSAGTYGSTNYAIGSTSPAPYLSSVEESASSAYAGRLEMKTTRTIQQEINGAQTFRPTFWAVRFYIATGTSVNFTVSWGGKSQTYSESDLTADAWATITPDMDLDLFPYNWRDGSNLFKITINSISGGSLFIDNAVFANMSNFNGTWFAILPGTTQTLAGASPRKFVFEDTVSSDTVIQRLLGIGYGRFLPSNTDTTEITDP